MSGAELSIFRLLGSVFASAERPILGFIPGQDESCGSSLPELRVNKQMVTSISGLDLASAALAPE